MPHAEHRARYGCERILGKVYRGKRRCKAGILHPHLYGHRLSLGHVHLQRLCGGVSQGVTQQVVQYYYAEYEQSAAHQTGGIGTDHGPYYGHYGQCGDEWQHVNRPFGEPGAEPVYRKAYGYGQHHHLYDGEKHGDHVHIHGLSGIYIGEQRCQHGG